MVCGVCLVDRTDGQALILDYPRYMACGGQCPNCGGLGVSRVVLPSGDAARVALARRRARQAGPCKSVKVV